MDSKKLKQAIADIDKHLKSKYVEAQQMRYNAYKGEQQSDLLKSLEQMAPRTSDKIDPIWLNVTKVVVDRRAGKLYDKAPKRSYTQNGNPVADDLAAKLDAMLKAAGFNTSMDKLSRYCFNHKTVLAYVEPRDGYPRVETLPPMTHYISAGTPDPTRLENAKYLAVVGAGGTRRLWSKEDWVDLDSKGNVTDQGENPYGKYPAVVVHAEDPDQNIYIKGGSDLQAIAAHFAVELSDTGFIARLSSFGVPVFKGGDGGKLTLSPNHAINIAQGDDFDFAAPPALLEERLNRMNAILSQLAVTYQLPADEFEPNKQPVSGVSRRIMSAQLVEARETWANRMRWYEAEIFKVMVAVYNEHSDTKLPDGLEVDTVFGSQALPLDPTEQAEIDRSDLASGVKSPVDLIMRERGVSEEQAEEIYEKNLERIRKGNIARSAIPVIGGR